MMDAAMGWGADTIASDIDCPGAESWGSWDDCADGDCPTADNVADVAGDSSDCPWTDCSGMDSWGSWDTDCSMAGSYV